MFKRLMIAAGTAAISLAVLAGPAAAAGNGSATPNPIPVPAINPATGYSFKTDATTVSWTAMQPNKPVYISICRRAQSDPEFGSFGNSCSAISEVIVSAAFQTNGAGSKAIKVFRGENPDGDSGWGCYAAGDTAPAGVEKLTTCYVRLASDAQTDSTYAFTIPFTITDDGSPVSTTTTTTPEPVIPESGSPGTTIFLPLVAGGAALFGLGVQRRLRSAKR